MKRCWAPNRFAVDWINANLLPRIGELLRDKGTGDAQIVTVEVGSRAPLRAAVPAVVRAPANNHARRGEGLVVGARLNPATSSFASFVEGKSNQLAKAAPHGRLLHWKSRRAPTTLLFLYSGVGPGKTQPSCTPLHT